MGQAGPRVRTQGAMRGARAHLSTQGLEKVLDIPLRDLRRETGRRRRGDAHEGWQRHPQGLHSSALPGGRGVDPLPPEGKGVDPLPPGGKGVDPLPALHPWFSSCIPEPALPLPRSLLSGRWASTCCPHPGHSATGPGSRSRSSPCGQCWCSTRCVHKAPALHRSARDHTQHAPPTITTQVHPQRGRSSTHTKVRPTQARLPVKAGVPGAPKAHAQVLQRTLGR